ncbi:uncharacterized protein LOC130700905 [Daphnia carinata]|uniref:uncharacterized protein LOC130700905 n=1 Tax=Daphnia carinata TaxID=120202 RepID=UPI00257E8E0E|nr:uncharacterized protein LOC130700905 [Daphnia carinata]
MSCKESTVMLKCGLLVGDKQIGDFKFISWFDDQPKLYARQQSKGSATTQTLREKLKTIFPDVVQPFQVVFIDKYDDKIILPIDDIKETVTALQCFSYLSSLPLQIFVQLPGQKQPSNDVLQNKEYNAVIPCCENSGLKIVDTLNRLERTIHTLGERIVTLLEDFGKSSTTDLKRSEKENKSADVALDEEQRNMAVSLESTTIKASQSNSDADYFGNGDSPLVRSSTLSSSSSSFSVQSHSGEEDWTRVGGGIDIGGRRRRFTTESSCASHQSDRSQDGVVRSMEDEMSSITFDMLCRNP